MRQSNSFWYVEQQRRSTLDDTAGRSVNFFEIARLPVPAPPGYTIDCGSQETFEKEFMDSVRAAVASIEHRMGQALGDPRNPLLVAVRSAAGAQSMRGYRAVLNIGLNGEIVESLCALTKNPRFVYDCYRRFLVTFACGATQLGSRSMIRRTLDRVSDVFKSQAGAVSETDLSAEDLRDLCDAYRRLICEEIGLVIPDDPMEQLETATKAVATGIEQKSAALPPLQVSDAAGKVVVQSMVFGNMGDDCGAGLAWSRNPMSGVKEDSGIYLSNATGDDLRSGIRRPVPLCDVEAKRMDVARQLHNVRAALSHHLPGDYAFDFTVEHGKVYVLNYSDVSVPSSYTTQRSFPRPSVHHTRAA